MSKTIQLLVISVFAFLAIACSDDSDFPKYPVLQDGVADVANGYSSIIIDLDKLKNIRLYTDREISLENENDFVGFEVIKEDGKQYVKPFLKKDISEIKPFMTKLKIKIQSYLDSRNATYEESEDEMTKDLYISFRRTTAAPDNVDVNYARAIGKGTKPWGDMGNVTYPILDFNAIYEHIGKNENLTLKSIFFETSGERYISSLEKLGVNLGLSATNQGIGKYFFSGSASYGINKSTSKSTYYEYYIGYYGKKMSEVRLNEDWIYNQNSLCALLDTTVNNVLNNQGTKAYQKYSNDSVGIFALLEQYGTHIITQASFGGNYTVLYGREENAYETSVGHDAGASIGSKMPMNGTSTWRDIYLNKTASPAVSGTVDVSKYEEERDLASESFHIITAKGGNASEDMDAWDKSVTLDSKDTWIPISYLLEGDSKDKSSLLPIYELVVDSTRRAAIAKYMDAFIESHSPDTVDSPMIIVDFMMKAAGTNKRKDGLPTSFIDKDPYGVRRWYYPLMANSNAPADAGYALETSGRDFIHLIEDDDHYWYYALGHVDEENQVYGITDIRFAEEGADGTDGFTRRGDHCHVGIKNNAALESRYVYLKYAPKGTDISQLIKGIGLEDIDEGKVIASTGGTEMVYPFGTDNYSRYNKYWGKDLYQITGTHWYTGGYIRPCKIRPVYTLQNLDVNFSFGDGNVKGKISHPKKWGE